MSLCLAWLDNPSKSYDQYRRNGGDTTINSILGQSLWMPSLTVWITTVLEKAPGLVEFIVKCLLLLETDKYILFWDWLSGGTCFQLSKSLDSNSFP